MFRSLKFLEEASTNSGKPGCSSPLHFSQVNIYENVSACPCGLHLFLINLTIQFSNYISRNYRTYNNHYKNYMQPYLQDPWNEPLAPVLAKLPSNLSTMLPNENLIVSSCLMISLTFFCSYKCQFYTWFYHKSKLVSEFTCPYHVTTKRH